MIMHVRQRWSLCGKQGQTFWLECSLIGRLNSWPFFTSYMYTVNINSDIGPTNQHTWRCVDVMRPLLLRIVRSQLRWFKHLLWLPPGCLPLEVFRAKPIGRRPWSWPRTHSPGRTCSPGEAAELYSFPAKMGFQGRGGPVVATIVTWHPQSNEVLGAGAGSLCVHLFLCVSPRNCRHLGYHKIFFKEHFNPWILFYRSPPPSSVTRVHHLLSGDKQVTATAANSDRLLALWQTETYPWYFAAIGWMKNVLTEMLKAKKAKLHTCGEEENVSSIYFFTVDMTYMHQPFPSASSPRE